MEKKLKQLFDYQKFARNPWLDAMLAEAEGRCGALDDEDLGLVSAAGILSGDPTRKVTEGPGPFVTDDHPFDTNEEMIP